MDGGTLINSKILLSLLLLAPILAEAKPREIPVEVWSIQGEGALSLPYTIRAFGKASRKLENELGVRFKARRYRRTFNRFYLNNTIERFKYIHPSWDYWTYRKSPRDVVRLAVLPPLRSDDGSRWFAGAANLCDLTGFAWTNGGYANTSGLGRFKLSVGIIVHELGHIAGADHDPDDVIAMMNPDAGRYILQLGLSSMYFSDSSKTQVGQCLSLWGV